MIALTVTCRLASSNQAYSSGNSACTAALNLVIAPGSAVDQAAVEDPAAAVPAAAAAVRSPPPLPVSRDDPELLWVGVLPAATAVADCGWPRPR
jgi:hypothetical protein